MICAGRVAALALAWLPLNVAAQEIRFQPVAPGVWAHIGDTGGRSVGNQGLNANIGLVLTSAGALLIDSGATTQSAQAIEDAVRRLTAQPVRWVINTGGQDHRWLGNAHFKSQGAKLIAHETALADMQARGGEQLAALRKLLGPGANGTTPVLPNHLIRTANAVFMIGNVRVETRHRGGGHTPGDMMVWLPRQRVLFTGDVVYVDRLLAVLPVSSTRRWLDSVAVINLLQPEHIVPGHGGLTTLAVAQAHTRAYLLALRAHMKQAVQGGVEISQAIESFDHRPFLHLRHASELNAGNASRTYLEVERE